MRVFVLDQNKTPLDPCHPARARELLKKGRAKVFKPYPFTIVLQARTVQDSVTHPHRIKIDPGSKTTGIAIVQESTGRVTNALEINHRGQQIKKALESRRALRRGRRNRKTRYRQGSGGLTKYNRKTKGIEKTHWADAACVGKSTPEKLLLKGVQPLTVTAKGHGIRQRCRPNKYGFPRDTAPSEKFFQGFQTGDIVKANIPKGKYAGQYTGRIAIRYRPSFVLQLQSQKFDVHPKYLQTIFRADGYEYQVN